MNKITIFGNVTRDAEVRYGKDGGAIGSFRVACNVGWGEREETVFFSCAMFKTRAEKICPYIAKGMKIAVIGQLRPPRLYDRANGEKGVDLDIWVDEVQFTSEPSKGHNTAPRPAATPPKTPKPAAPEPTLFDDDIPF